MQKTFSDAIANVPVRPFQWLVAILAFAVLMFDGIDMQSLALVAPRIFEEWGIDRAEFGPAMAAALFGMAIGAAAGGWLGDRFGRATMLFVAALAFGLATIAAGFAHDVWSMTAVRVLGGLGFGAAFPNSMALTNDWMPQRLKAYSVATLSLGVPAGTTVTGVVVPELMEAAGWRGVFYVFGAASVVLAIVILACLRESPAYLLAKGRKDAARRAAARVLDQEVELLPEPERAGEELPEGENVGVFDASNTRLNLGIGIGFAAATAVVYGLMNWGPELLTSRGFTLPQAQRMSFTVGLLSMIGGFSAGYLTTRFGSKRVMAASSIGTCLLVLLLAWLVEHIAGVPSLLLRQTILWLLGIITGMTSVGIATIYVMMAQGYQQSCRSGGIGFGMLMGRIGGILMAFFGGELLNLGGGSFYVYFAAIFVGGVGVMAASVIVDRHVPPAARS